MSLQETLQCLIEEKLQVQSSRPGEGEHKAGEFAFGLPNDNFAEVSPVGLALLSREGPQRQKGFLTGRTQASNNTS